MKGETTKAHANKTNQGQKRLKTREFKQKINLSIHKQLLKQKLFRDY